MTPLEINKRIAEIKGWMICPHIDCKMVHKHDADGNEISYAPVNYAENITVAWELFEDLGISASIKKIGSGEHDGLYEVRFTYSHDNYGDVLEYGVCKAICFAWINWKEQSATQKQYMEIM